MTRKKKTLLSYLQNSISTEQCLFIVLLLLQLLVFGYLILTRRMPGGWDGFQYFHVQYYFLNNKLVFGEIPQWLPYLTQGTVSTWWYAIQAGLLQSVLFEFGFLFNTLLQQTNFLSIFHVGMFIDEFILILGTWLLARHFYKSVLTVFFVTATVAGSCIWMTQPWYNFHFYYAIPLVLHFGHVFLETSRWRYFLLAGNFLAFQTLGSLPYLIPVVSLTVFLYFGLYFFINLQTMLPGLKKIRINGRAVLSILLVAVSFYLAFAVTTVNTEQIINYNYERNLDGKTDLAGFLLYGRNFNLVKWAELLLAASPTMDYTLYIGFLSLPLILLFLITHVNRTNLHFVILVILLLLFTMATFFSSLVYHLWPGMSYYRHLALSSPVIKLFLCFLAGFGFQALLDPKQSKRSKVYFRNVLIILSLLLFGLTIFLFTISRDIDFAEKLLQNLVQGSTYEVDTANQKLKYISGLITYIEREALGMMMKLFALFAFIQSVLFFIYSYVFDKQKGKVLLGAMLFIHVLNMYGYKFLQNDQKSVALNDETYKITEFQPAPFFNRRYQEYVPDTPRDKILFALRFRPLYWSTYLILFKEEAGHFLRTDHWLWPLDRYMKAYWGQPITDLSQPPQGLNHYNFLKFPLDHPAAGKIAGLSEDKIQFFSKAYGIADDEQLAKLITDDRYKGDILFMSDAQQIPEWTSRSSLAENYRVNLNYEINSFDANNLELTVNTQERESVWLLFSDVWHPQWRARVNGKEVSVHRANLAYKAIRLQEGKNKIQFTFQSKLLLFLFRFWGWLALFWLGMLIYLTKRMLKE